MPYTDIWIHLVWRVKRHHPQLHKGLRSKVIYHIRRNAKQKGIYIHSLNGYTDHMHALLCLKPDQSVSQIAQLIKGESSYWINKHFLTEKFFRWQEEYYAISVSPSVVNRVNAYIQNQENHHLHLSFKDEFHIMMNSLSISDKDVSLG